MLPLREGEKEVVPIKGRGKVDAPIKGRGGLLSRNPVKGGEEKRGWGGAGDKGVLKGTRFTGLSS